MLAATDPGQPFGAALPWPEPAGAGRPARTAGAHVVLADGELVAFVERGAHSLVTFAATSAQPDWPAGVRWLADSGRRRSVEIRKIDGEPASESRHAATLREAGFVDGYKGLVYRARR